MTLEKDREALESPSSRRAWIEIDGYKVGDVVQFRRPPRGGRG